MCSSSEGSTKARLEDQRGESGLRSLAALGTQEVKKNGIFTIPGLCRIKTKTKKATKAGKRMMFGQEVKVKAKPARTVVKAFAVAALKNQI